MDRLRAMPQRGAHASRQPVVHRARPGRPGATYALQHAADEFVAQFFAQRPLARLFFEKQVAFTQMYLTHLDAGGKNSPPILIENSTASNRAVNIPEFLNVAPDGLRRIGGPVLDYYRLFNSAA